MQVRADHDGRIEESIAAQKKASDDQKRRDLFLSVLWIITSVSLICPSRHAGLVCEKLRINGRFFTKVHNAMVGLRNFSLYANRIKPLGPLVYRQRRTWMSTAGIEKSHTAMIFPGQGAQYVGMGKDLYDTFKEARAVFDEAEHVLGINLVNLIFEGEQEKLKLTENAQPAILTTSIAIVRVLEECFGFKVEEECTYVLGHSLGEYSALVAAKSLSLGDALRLVRARGKAMQKSVGNKSTAMSALVMRRQHLGELANAMKEVQKDLPEGELVELANINSSFQVVISGTSRGVDIASQYLQQRNLAARAVDLPVSAPFHCSLMKEAAEEMEKALAKIKFADPVVKVLSNVTAKPIQDATEIPPLLVRQVTSTVQWHNSIKYLKDHDINDFIVFGPGRVLANLLKKEYPMDRLRPTANVESIRQLGEQALHKKNAEGDKAKA